MPNNLSDILKGVKKSTTVALTTGNIPGVDYADKMKDSRDFVAMHSVEKHADRVGNGDDVYKGSTKKAKMERHGHEPKPKDVKVYNKTQQVASVKEEAEELDEAGLGMKKFKKAFKGTGPEGTGDPRPMKKRLRDDPEHAKIIASKTGKLSGMAELQRRIAKRLTKEEFKISEAKDEREYGYEGDMAITQLKTICRHAEHLMKMMKPNTDLPEWVQSKITKAEDYISTAHDYLMSEMNEEVEELDEAKCNMTEAGKMCEVHGMKACTKEDNESASDKEPRYNGKKKEGRQLITDKKLQEMSTSQNQAIAARIALKHKRESTMPPKGTASHSMMGMSEKQLKDYTKAEPGAPKKVEESLADQRSSKATASEKAREKIHAALEKRKLQRMKEQAAPAETVIRMPSGDVGDTGRV
jgi:hypothetical protein